MALQWQGDSQSIDGTLAAIVPGDGKVSRLAGRERFGQRTRAAQVLAS